MSGAGYTLPFVHSVICNCILYLNILLPHRIEPCGAAAGALVSFFFRSEDSLPTLLRVLNQRIGYDLLNGGSVVHLKRTLERMELVMVTTKRDLRTKEGRRLVGLWQAQKKETSTVFSVVDWGDIPYHQVQITPWQAQMTRSMIVKSRGVVREEQKRV